MHDDGQREVSNRRVEELIYWYEELKGIVNFNMKAFYTCRHKSL